MMDKSPCMKAVIQAGGKGTRMKDYTKLIPKPMLKVGDKPILQHQIELLAKYSIYETIIVVNHLKDSIINHFSDGKQFGVHITYYEEEKPLGTVGGIKELENRLDTDFIVLYGDIMINMDIQRFVDFHYQHQSECTLALHPNDHPYDSDLVEMDHNNRITAFHSKPHDKNTYYRNLVNAGAYIFSPAIFPFLPKGEKKDFGKDIFPKIYNRCNMFGYNTSEYMKDMGTPQRWDEVTQDLYSGKIKRKSYEYKQKAIFLDRDGVINKDTNFIHKPEELQLYDFTPAAIKNINNTDYLAIVATNQSVIARNLCTVEELDYIHKKLETELGNEGAKLDAIYYCPHHPDKGYPEEMPEYKIDCECRKPKPGMLLKAAKDFNIDLKRSFMIGDSERDMVAGKTAGCKTIGVMTGKGLKNTSTVPGYFFQNLGEAIEFVTKEPYLEEFKKVKEKFHKTNEKPFVILIGGNARSGKSIFSKYLEDKFIEEGHSVITVKLDEWILPKAQRHQCHNVYDRFRKEQLVGDIKNLLEGEKIIAPGYSPRPGQNANPVGYSIQGKEIVIIEGVVGLAFEELRERASISIFLDMDEQLHKKRFYQLYDWKGFDKAYIDHLYQKRKKDEYDLIRKNHTFADITIKSKQS